MENVTILAKKKFTMEKCSSQVKILAEGSVKNVLEISAADVCSSCEVGAGFVVVSGKVKVDAVYVSDENEIKSAELVQDFSFKEQHTVTLENASAKATPAVASFSVSNGEILCFIEHEISVCGNYRYELPNFEEENGLVLNKKSLSYQKFVVGATDDFVVAQEIESSLENANVLLSNASILVNNVSVSVDKVTMEGKVLVSITQKDEKGMFSTNKEFEFKQEIEAVGALPNMTAEVVCSVNNITVTPEPTDDKTTLVCVTDVHASVNVFDEDTISISNDVFSLKNETTNSYSYLEMQNYCGESNFVDTTLATFDVSSLDGFDDIVGVFDPKFRLESTEMIAGKQIISGQISSLIIYKTAEGNIFSKKQLFPAKIEVGAEENKTLRNFDASVLVSSFKVKAGKDLEIVFALLGTVSFSSEVSEKYVKSYELEAEKNTGFTGIKVYVTAAGESVFEVARNLNVTPEMILSQNEVSGDFEGGEKIYVYCPVI